VVLFVSVAWAASSWNQCEDIPLLPNTCVTLSRYSLQGIPVLQVQLSVNSTTYLNTTMTEGVAGRSTCVSQDNLVQLMNDTPDLTQYTTEVNTVVQKYGFIPPTDYSLCVSFESVALNSTSGALGGCTNVDATLMCFESSCAYKGVVAYGCWSLSA